MQATSTTIWRGASSWRTHIRVSNGSCGSCGSCGHAAHVTTGPDETPRDASALTEFAGAAGWVAAGSRDGIVRLWHIGAPLPHAIQRNHTSRIAAVAMDPKARWFATGGWDAQVMFWTIPAAAAVDTEKGAAPPTVSELLEILRKAR